MNKNPSTLIALRSPCKECGHTGGLLIKPHPAHLGLIKCDCCDTY
ncbi:MAG: hypothetical protein V7K89_32945 [Nostoc sp.]